mmetsp:Transcript_25689/g.67408  ORF Transcript_25689/g.67408 Transcript_25689/m.67408 type:complete len:165 (+) Transcript_25689:1085-1579(+)
MAGSRKEASHDQCRAFLAALGFDTDIIQNWELKDTVRAFVGPNGAPLGTITVATLNSLLNDEMESRARDIESQLHARQEWDKTRVQNARSAATGALTSREEQVECYLRLVSVLRQVADVYKGRSGRSKGPDTPSLPMSFRPRWDSLGFGTAACCESQLLQLSGV